jgi:hypothetical protein
LLTSSVLTALRQTAADNTLQWQAFKSRLDGNLNVVIAENQGAYEGDYLSWISDYALGYQILKDSDSTTADEYADKAIGLMKSGMDDYQKGLWVARQFLQRGDGKTLTFTLPDDDVVPSSLLVFLSKVTVQKVIRGGTPDTQDTIPQGNGDYPQILKVSNTPDGTADYQKGVDWRSNPDLPINMTDPNNAVLPIDEIDWSPPGNEPKAGAAYYLSLASGADAQTASVSYDQTAHTITFGTAPSSRQAIFVEYIYGTHAADDSTLAFQQTSAGDGGFDSIYVDTTYTSRYLGKHIAMGLDWLDGYQGLTTTLENKAIDLLVRWSDYVRDNGYLANQPESNYAEGAYVSRVMTALALNGRSSEAPRLLNEVLAYRQTYVLPLLQQDALDVSGPPAYRQGTLAGGFWAEGWNYGELATENLLLAGLALQSTGQVTDFPEGAWAGNVIENLITTRDGKSVYDGGDWYNYPAPFPGTATPSDLFYVLAAASTNASDRAYANFVVQNIQEPAAGDTGDAIDLLFHDPAAQATDWSTQLPLQNFAPGTGLLSARSDWGSTANLVTLQMGNPLGCDHQQLAAGQVELQRGNDHLLINTNALSGASSYGLLDPSVRSKMSNVVVVDSHGAINPATGTPLQTYPYNMATDPQAYGTPGVVVNAQESTGSYVYLYGDYHVAYSTDDSPGTGGPVSELTRQLVYLRPGYVIVYDRVTTLRAGYVKQLRWDFLRGPIVTGNAFVETVGGSKLFGDTFSTAGLTTASAVRRFGPAPNPLAFGQVITQNATPQTSIRYVTAFEIAPSTTAAMDSTRHILSMDGRMEGVQVGGQVVLFGRNGIVSPASPVTYSFSGSSSVQHLLTNLLPGQIYQVIGNGIVLTTLTASEQGTITFSTPAGVKTVTIHGNLTLALSGASLIEGPNNYVIVASFIDANPQANSNNYAATITWGDGATSTASTAGGTIVANGQGGYNILGSHTYGGEVKGLTFRVQITDGGAAPDTQSTSLNVQPLALTLTPPAAAEGQALGQILVGYFSDPDFTGSLAGYSARVSWGDGQVSSTAAHNVTIQSDPQQAGVFDILATKPTAYAEGAKTLIFRVSVSEPAGAVASVSTTISIADPALSLTLAPPAPQKGQRLADILVGTFIDPDPDAIGDYMALVAWGDGETSSSAGGNIFIQADRRHKGMFDIRATKPHPYAAAATALTFVVMVSDTGGAAQSSATTINVSG